MAAYLLGVDGGNSKCDFLLFTAEGRLVDVLRAETCSHEQLSGYDEADAKMRAHTERLLGRNGLGMGDVRAAAMGLAGVDLPDQRDALMARVGRWGLGALEIRNDAVLGLKAASPTGSGVCCVNGSGTVVVGVGDDGAFLQIGGIGECTGDLAGGMFAATRIACAAYDQLYRGYPRTALADAVLQTLGLRDESEYMQAVHEGPVVRRHATQLNVLAQRLANEGDPAARRVYDDMGERLGRSAAGCIARLRFREPVAVVLAGSVFVKCDYPGLRQSFERFLAAGTPLETRTVALTVPPCVGAVLWARQLLPGPAQTPEERERVVAQLTNARYEQLVFGA